MELVHQKDMLEEAGEWVVLALGQVPQGTVFVPIAEKKFPINRVCRAST
ncbi:MAG: hypothetical protein PHY28_08395 [Dehalococcoidales bacterium]|nr:hypothetical protein [Dehalococcoidales bacterium]